MNKPVIQGTKKHSALLATAKAEQVRTHGSDPSLVDASALYGASNSPDVIDYKIKQAKIKWDKKKKKKKEKTKKKIEEEVVTPTEEVTTEEVTEEEIPTITINEKKVEIAKVDEEAARKRLYESVTMTQVPTEKTLELLPEATLEEKITKAKELEKEPGQYYEKGSLITKSVGGVSTQNLKTSYTEEEQSRLIFSEEHGRMVLPEEIGIKPDIVIESKKLDKKIKKATVESEKKVEKKDKIELSKKAIPPANLRREYKKASQWKKWQMEKKYRRYQF